MEKEERGGTGFMSNPGPITSEPIHYKKTPPKNTKTNNSFKVWAKSKQMVQRVLVGQEPDEPGRPANRAWPHWREAN